MSRTMTCLFFLSTLVLPLAACGLAETAATGATVATAEIEAAKQAQKTEQQAQEKVEAAQQAAAEKLRAADTAAAQ